MSDVPLMFRPLARYADFEGRSRRSEFWLWVLFRILLGLVTGTGLIYFMTHGMDFDHPTPMAFLTRYFHVVPPVGLLHLALLIPSIAVGVRRLHDINRTGWWLIVPHVIGIIGVVVFFTLNGGELIRLISQQAPLDEAGLYHFAGKMALTAICLMGLPTLIAQIVLFVFFVTEGTRGPNRFGADPKGRIALPEDEDAY